MITVAVVSLGCVKNRVDTELMLGILEKNGFAVTADERQADVLIVNTCGFIEPAKEESIDTLLSLAQYKETGRLRLLVATGCLTQRYEAELLRELPEVDLLLGVNQYERLPQAIMEAFQGKRASYCADDRHILTGGRVLTTPPYTAYVRIAEGCDNRCSYCAIPLIRGGFRSRPMDGVLAEIGTLAESGVREHILIAQDTTRFGMDTHGRSLLPDLLERAAAIEGVRWLRVLYCYPDEADERLLDTMAARENICRYLDLPLQHAHPDILKRMNRRGDIGGIKAFLRKARAMGFTLRTTMIVGFPGETDAHFRTLMSFVREMEFDRLGAFTFSPEEDTPAASMPGQVPDEVKAARLDELMTAQREISRGRSRLRIGQTATALIEEIGADGAAVARTDREAPDADGVCRLTGARGLTPGAFVSVRITGADAYDISGVIR
jgi:ribosomal protein S12 methylthiotransferase